ncbi:hypothetical protein [Streptomyces sp. NPDC006552]|uniref:hypothetical protein n=1 Tax=Streptomyces sp. NPDC006552 TaxID=3157179 RepID=UPI0033A6F883
MSAGAAAEAVLDRDFRGVVGNSFDVPSGGSSRLWLRSVPAGPVPERTAGHPLSLGPDARARLGGAIRRLLDTAGLAGVSDAVRLAVLVLASRTPSETGVVEIYTSELGRWIGASASYTASEVVPVLRRSGVVSVETVEGEYGQDDGLECKVLPLWAAQGVVGHPLNLAKKEFATLQRLVEAVMAPGWKHRGGRVTPAGLIGTRTGRGAATDRLALLLLVLEARETGRVRQCGGSVDTKRGRAAATVARLLGCTASAGERVLERLEDRELVLRVRLKTGSGLRSRSRLMVPAVAAAHGRMVADDVQEDRAQAPEPGFSDPDIAAGPGEAPETATEAQVSGGPVTDVTGVAEPDVAAALHTDHPHLVTPVCPPAFSGGFSGEGRRGSGDLPDGACVHENGGPLRGETPKEPQVDEQEQVGQRAAKGKAPQQRPMSLPADLRLRVALEPVSWLWARLSGWQQQQVETAAQAELEQLKGLLSQPDGAPKLLADRLGARLREVGGEALIRQPFGWLTRRGLVQRQSCTDPRCDDGMRLDTRGDCENCGNVIDLRRARHRSVAAQVDRQLPHLTPGERQQVLEERLREQAATHAQALERRRERITVERQQAAAAHAARLARQEQKDAAAAAAQALRQAQPCQACGAPDAAGHCTTCASRESTARLLRDAVDLALAARTDVTDPGEVAGLLTRCTADTRALLTRTAGGDDPATLAQAEEQVARRIRLERRRTAVARLSRSAVAVEAGDAAYAAHRERFPLAPKHDAEQAALAAEQRTAEQLLNERLDQLTAHHETELAHA